MRRHRNLPYASKPKVANIIPLIFNSRPRPSVLEAVNAVPQTFGPKRYHHGPEVVGKIQPRVP
jgi:hypothetical protein